MNQHIKRICSILLAAVLLAGAMPVAANAAKTPPRIVVGADENGYPTITCEPPPELADAVQLRYDWYFSRFGISGAWISFSLAAEGPYTPAQTLCLADYVHTSARLGMEPDMYRFSCDIYYRDGLRWERYYPSGETDWVELPFPPDYPGDYPESGFMQSTGTNAPGITLTFVPSDYAPGGELTTDWYVRPLGQLRWQLMSETENETTFTVTAAEGAPGYYLPPGQYQFCATYYYYPANGRPYSFGINHRRTKTITLDPNHAHTYTEVVTPASPDAQGYTTHTCAGCGDSYADGYTDYKDDPPAKTIFRTAYESNLWNWIRFIFLFGWIWMWF